MITNISYAIILPPPLLLFSIIIIAQFSKTLAKNKSRRERVNEAKVNSAFSDEDERRNAWIEYYVADGQLDKARALGWVEQEPAAELPQWRQFEIEQRQSASPSVLRWCHGSGPNNVRSGTWPRSLEPASIRLAKASDILLLRI